MHMYLINYKVNITSVFLYNMYTPVNICKLNVPKEDNALLYSLNYLKVLLNL